MKYAIRLLAALAAPVFAMSGAACTTSSSTTLAPKTVPSTRHEGYVQDFAPAFESAVKGTQDDAAKAKTIVEQMAAYPKDVKGGDANHLVAFVTAADESGRSAGYAARARELSNVQAFFDGERDAITRRVAGAAGTAQTKAKDGQCEPADVSGAVSYALKEGVEKQIEKRTRDRNEAHLYLERNRLALGKDNYATLEKQADQIAYAAYVVYVDLPERRNQLATLLSERSDVDSSIDRMLEEERVYQAEKGRTDPERKNSLERVASLQKGKATLKAYDADAQSLSKSLDDQIPQFQKAYDDAFKSLKQQYQAVPPPPVPAKAGNFAPVRTSSR